MLFFINLMHQLFKMSLNDLIEDYEERTEHEEREIEWNTALDIPVREPKQLWDRQNPLISFKNEEFYQHFRFSKENLLKVVDFIQEDLQFPNNRGLPLSPLQQVCLTLSYYTSGCYLRAAGYFIGVKRACACTTQKRVSSALCKKSHHLIKLPRPEELREAANDLCTQFGIPNCPLGVDGTHIRLENSPIQDDLPEGVHPQDFWCRKQFFSLNVQLIGDNRHLIRDLEAKWAGSTHDARVWKNSAAKVLLESQREFTVAADSAYPISRTILKPFRDPVPSQRHAKFNRALSGLRTICTENTIGIWKRRFPILKRGITTRVSTAIEITRACAMLHNMAILWQEQDVKGNTQDSNLGSN